MTPGSLPKPAGTRTPPIIAALWWLLPVAFLVVFYRDGLSTWFTADDFAFWFDDLYGNKNVVGVIYCHMEGI